LFEQGSTTGTADFDGTAKTCTLASGATQCTITINWDTSNLSNVDVYVRDHDYGSTRQLFSYDSSGSQDAAWIDANGKIFEIFSGSTSDPDYFDKPNAVINVVAVQ
jgi:hypothetical protein